MHDDLNRNVKLMKNEEIKRLVLGLQDDSPFLEEIRQRFFSRKKVLSPDDRLVYPMRDPAFEFHFAAAYARAKKMLPAEVFKASVWRAYSHLRYGIKNDPAGSEAITFGHPSNRGKQAWVKGLLCSGISYAEVAKWTGLSSEVVEVYAHWFFDFAERQDDETFVMSVLNPRTELSLIRNDRSPDRILLLMRLGHHLGPAAVIREMGLTDAQKDGAKGDQIANIKSALLTDAEMKAKMGLLEVDDPGFIAFKALLVEQARHEPDGMGDDARMGLTAISMSQSAQMVLKGLIMAGATEQLREAQHYDAQQAAEEAKRRKAAGSGGPANSVEHALSAGCLPSQTP
jgi:hypothetical protein